MGEHDKFFKKTFSIKEHAVDYLRQVLPSTINSKLDYSSIALENTSYIDDELAEHFSDMVYSCLYDQSEIRIAFLFEHKSSPDKNLPFQINKYMIKIWDTNLKQKEDFVPVVPVVLYHGKENWKPERLDSCFKYTPSELMQFIPDFDYIFVSLSSYEDEEIKDKVFTLASLKMSLLILKNIYYTEKLEKELRTFFELGKMFFNDDNGLNFLESILTYIYKVTDVPTIKVVEAIKNVTGKGEAIAMTTAERLRQEGMQKGMQSLIWNMKNNNLSEEDIAKFTSLELNLVKKILKNGKVEIPVHILNGK